MEYKAQDMSNKDQRSLGQNTNMPPNLFADQKPRRSSKKRFLLLTALFAMASAGILMIPFKASVKGIGETVPAKTYSVCAETPGKIAEVYCIEGTQVIAGSTIARLSNPKLESTIEETQKKWEIALAKLDVLKAEKKAKAEAAIRSKLYYEVGSISLREKRQTEDLLIAIDREIFIQDKEIEEIDATLKYMLAQKEKEMIKAPADGVILTPLKDRLEMVLSEGQEVFKLTGKEMSVEFFVPEEQVRLVSIGSAVNLRFVSDPLKTYHGSLSRMDSNVQTRQEKVWITKSGILVTIGLKEVLGLQPGQKVHVQILSERSHTLMQSLAARFLP